jgi:hypothetical protein
MNDEEERGLERLFALARQAGSEPLQDGGFEARVLARIREERERKEAWAVWAWRLAPLFLVVTLFLGAWDYAALNVPQPDLRSAITAGGGQEQFARLWTGE